VPANGKKGGRRNTPRNEISFAFRFWMYVVLDVCCSGCMLFWIMLFWMLCRSGCYVVLDVMLFWMYVVLDVMLFWMYVVLDVMLFWKYVVLRIRKRHFFPIN
jgi:hypothetical protein